VLRNSSWIHYAHLVRRYIIPHLGKIIIRDLRVDNIQAFYTRLINQNVGVPTIRKVHHVLHHSLNMAVETGAINRNPATFAHPPKKVTPEIAILDGSQASQFLIAVIGHRWEALFRLEVVTGMRQSEILGLKWVDLDWLRNTVRIERQLERPDKTGVKFIEPKTKSGKRTIDLDEITMQLLKGHYEHQQQERLAAGEKWNEHGLIFTTSIGTPIHFRNLVREFYQLLVGAGLPRIHFHALRHTAASLMLNNGVPAIIVSKRLGHARVSITEDVYGHLLMGRQAEAAKLISDLVTPVQLCPIVPKADFDSKTQQKLNGDLE
jgi:integrase